jgi:hypothetical protein
VWVGGWVGGRVGAQVLAAVRDSVFSQPSDSHTLKYTHTHIHTHRIANLRANIQEYRVSTQPLVNKNHKPHAQKKQTACTTKKQTAGVSVPPLPTPTHAYAHPRPPQDLLRETAEGKRHADEAMAAARGSEASLKVQLEALTRQSQALQEQLVRVCMYVYMYVCMLLFRCICMYMYVCTRPPSRCSWRP